MIGRLRLALACTLGALLLTPQAAAGGGWWSNLDVDRKVVAPGQRVEVAAEAFFPSTRAAEQAQEAGEFYVYLLRDFDYSVVHRAIGGRAPNWWSLGGAEAIQVGQVAVNVPNGNLGRATAAFTVPELPAATYHLMLCAAGCADPLATVIPAKGFTIVADPATARMAQRVDSLEGRIRSQARELEAARRRSDGARVALAEDVRSDVDQLESRVSSLAREIQNVPRPTPWTYAGWLLAGTFAAVVALLALRRRRGPRPTDPDPVQPHLSDEELHELLSSNAR
jgi:hypothetical protein